MKKIMTAVYILLVVALLITACSAPADGFAIETAGGTLYYPKKWEETVAVEETVNDEEIVISFQTTIEGEKVDLFCIVLNAQEEGAVGQIKGADGVKRFAHISMREIEEKGATDQDALNSLYIMQEDVNFVIDNMK